MNVDAPPNDRFSRVLSLIVSWALAGLFVYAAWPKIRDPSGFATDLRNYRLFPWWSLNAIALAAPWWELLAAAALLLPAWRRSGATIALGMGLIFLASVSQALARGLDINCGCFGHGESAQKAGLKTLALDGFIILSSMYVIRTCGAVTDGTTGHCEVRSIRRSDDLIARHSDEFSARHSDELSTCHSEELKTCHSEELETCHSEERSDEESGPAGERVPCLG